MAPFPSCLLGCPTAIGPASPDIQVPAFPAVQAESGTSPGSALITPAAGFAGLAVGPMSQATLSDSFCRSGPILPGTAPCALAPVGTAGSLALIAADRLRGRQAGAGG